MTVAKMIEQLKGMPANMQVRDTLGSPISYMAEKENGVYLEAISDIDIVTEIEETFSSRREDGDSDDAIFSDLGEYLKEAEIDQIKSDEYVGSDGFPKWEEFIKNGDIKGFNINNIEDNGWYIERIILPVGTIIARYGKASGSTSTLAGTSYDFLSLPYCVESKEYHEYKVVKKTYKICVVHRGVVAAGFDSIGGAIQFFHEKPIIDSVRESVLKEQWLIKAKEKRMLRMMHILKH